MNEVGNWPYRENGLVSRLETADDMGEVLSDQWEYGKHIQTIWVV